MKEQEQKKPKKAKLFSPRMIVLDFIRITGGLPGLLWFRPKYKYISKQAKKRVRGGALLIANHTSFRDPVYTLFALWYRRQFFVCHKVFFESKAAFWFRLVGCMIPIDANNMNIDSFRTITDRLKEGRVVTIFPEGHVRKDGVMQEFKSGAALMSMQSKCPIVPVYIKAPKHWYNRLVIVIGEQVDINEMSGGRPSFSKIREFTALLEEREKLLEEYANKK